MVAGTERVVISLGLLPGINRHVAEEVGRVGFWRNLAAEPDGVVSGQLGQISEDCVTDEIGVNE